MARCPSLLSLRHPGASMEVILGWRRAESVVTFALVALVYTLAGGLYSVVYTDVLQLAVTFFGLASEKEIFWVMRIATVVIGTVASMIAQLAMSAYAFWYLSSDLVYVLLLPHLLTVTYHNKECNAYGSLAGYVVGAVLRAGGGEDALNIPPFIRYPYYNARDGQLFPFRTFAMVMTYLTLRVVSRVSKWLFTDRVPLKFDLFKCFVAKPPMAKEDVSSKDAEEMPTKSDEQEQPVRHFLGMGVLLPTAVDQDVGVDSAEQKSLGEHTGNTTISGASAVPSVDLPAQQCSHSDKLQTAHLSPPKKRRHTRRKRPAPKKVPESQEPGDVQNSTEVARE